MSENKVDNTYDELMLKSVKKYNAMPDQIVQGDDVPKTFNERTIDTYIKWAQEGKSFMQLVMKKQDYWDPDQHLNLMEDLKVDQYCSNFNKEDFNPYLAQEYTTMKQEEYEQNKAKNQSQNKKNLNGNQLQNLKNTLWDTQTKKYAS